MPLFIVTSLASVVVHESVDESPIAIRVGDAMNVAVGVGGLTISVFDTIVEPVTFLAVKVYMVVLVGLTGTEPAADTTPILLFILN